MGARLHPCMKMAYGSLLDGPDGREADPPGARVAVAAVLVRSLRPVSSDVDEPARSATKGLPMRLPWSRERTIRELHALMDEPGVDRRFVVESGIFYAERCKRRNLGPELIDAIRKGAREMYVFQQLVNDAMRRKQGYR
jgi:hypothetical protein